MKDEMFLKQLQALEEGDPTETLTAQIELIVRRYIENTSLDRWVEILVKHHGRDAVRAAIEKAGAQ